jgi:hypothetical protein
VNARIGRFFGVAFERMGAKKRPAKQSQKKLDRRTGWGEQIVGGVTAPSDEAVQGRNELERVAWKYICEGKPSDEWTETQKLGLRLVSDIGLMFLHGPCDPDGRIVLRRALSVFRSPDTLRNRRVWSVRAIREHGMLWHRRTHPEDFLADSLVRVLPIYDEVFRKLQSDLAGVKGKLDSFDPKPAGKAGKKSAETILAELIVEVDKEALGLKPKPNEDRADAVIRIQRTLSKEIDDFLQESLEAQKA